MISIKENLFTVRKIFKLSQEDFGKRIGLSKASVSAIEKGNRDVTDRTIRLICIEFNIDENWLRTGEGDMFVALPTEELDMLAERYNLSSSAKKIVQLFVELEENEMDAVMRFIDKIASISDEPVDSQRGKIGESLKQPQSIVSEMQECKKNAPNGMAFRVARSKSHTDGEWVEKDKQRTEKFKNAPRVTSDDDL